MRPESRSNSLSSVSSSADAEDTMQIFIKNLAGETFPLSVPATTSISTLRNLVALRTNMASRDLRIVYAGRHLSDMKSTLASYNIASDSTLHLALSTRSGAPKKIRCGFKSCKDAAQRIVGECSFCNGQFCGKHRLLESHNCEGLEDCKKESHERNADKLNSERTVVIKGV